MKQQYEIVKVHRENNRITKFLCNYLGDKNIGVLEFQRTALVNSLNQKIQQFFVNIDGKSVPLCIVQEQDPELFVTINPNIKTKDDVGILPEY